MNSLTDRLRVAVLPLDICLADKEANLRAVEDALRSMPDGTDIVVLPELFSTGFVGDADAMAGMAERNTGETVDRIHRWANECHCAFCGSYLASTPPHLYNRAFFIEPNGDETFYDKAHLFSVSKEADIFAPGRALPPSVRFRGWNVSMIVCYDLRFPAWCRNADLRYDIMLVPANWPQSRSYAWKHLLIARAIENQAPIVGADRGGEDQYGVYEGLALCFDSLGKPTGGKYGDGPWVVADFHKGELTEHRRKFPVVADADTFELYLNR